MAKANERKARKAKARQEAIRKRKAAATAQPRALRQAPDLAEALSTRHPLVGYFVNDNWAETRLASVHVIREAPSGQVLGGFLVDLMWLGLKDAYGRHGELNALDTLVTTLRKNNPALSLVPMEPDVAVNLIRGGAAWAQRWHYPLPSDLDLWMRLVDPAPAAGLDFSMFGEGGERPQIFGTPEEVARYEHLDIEDQEILPPEDEIEAEAEALAGPPGGQAAGPGGLWLPGGQAPGAARLWLPGGRRDEENT